MSQEQIRCVLEKKGILDTEKLAAFINQKTQGIALQVMKEVFLLKCKGGYFILLERIKREQFL